jgi:hypothetical protein
MIYTRRLVYVKVHLRNFKVWIEDVNKGPENTATMLAPLCNPSQHSGYRT